MQLLEKDPPQRRKHIAQLQQHEDALLQLLEEEEPAAGVEAGAAPPQSLWRILVEAIFVRVQRTLLEAKAALSAYSHGG